MSTPKNCATPCKECPWRRKSMPGWVGEVHPEEWVALAHGDEKILCHLAHAHQCRGAAIFRRNVHKHPRDPAVLVGEPDRVRVFASDQEFIDHHRKLGFTSADTTAALFAKK